MFSFFAGCNAAYDVGAVFQTIFGISCGDLSGETLVDDTSVFSNS